MERTKGKARKSVAGRAGKSARGKGKRKGQRLKARRVGTNFESTEDGWATRRLQKYE